MEYPWYSLVNNNILFQGDIFENCQIIIPKYENINENEVLESDVDEHDIIILSQSCDLGNNKLALVQACPIYPLDFYIELNYKKLSKKEIYKFKERIRQGNQPNLHLLNKTDLIDGLLKDNLLLVDFRQNFSIPIDYLKTKASSNRLRLLSPYVEHLSQAYARFFMRVGLPIDIPAFKK